MKVLLINFTMDPDSPVLAWQYHVARRMAARCERLVILTEGSIAPGVRANLPPNVELHQVPRAFTTPLRKLGAKWLMNVAVWRWCARERFDAAFVHMNAEWVYRLAPCWRRFKVPVVLWYAHGTVTDRLHKALEHATCVVTSSPEGFRIPSPKVRIIGQGIDTDLFAPPSARTDSPTIVAVGRVSRRKSVDLMVETMAWLNAHASQPFMLRIVGPMLTRDDRVYGAELAQTIVGRGLSDCVQIDGPRPMNVLADIYGSAFVHLNLSETGSIDKAILEAFSCGCPTLTSNPAVFSLLTPFPGLIVRDRTPEAIGRQILDIYQQRHAYGRADLRALVTGRHDIDSYADKVCGILTELAHN